MRVSQVSRRITVSSVPKPNVTVRAGNPVTGARIRKTGSPPLVAASDQLKARSPSASTIDCEALHTRRRLASSQISVQVPKFSIVRRVPGADGAPSTGFTR